VLNELALKASIVRLYSQPYAEVYPNLWYFSANQPISVWIGRIALGWERLLLYPSGIIPLIYYIFVPLSVLALVVMVKMANRRGTLMFLREAKVFLWLAMVCATYVPYSLLYEPENHERWDSILPGLIVMSSVAVHYVRSRIADFAGLAPHASLMRKAGTVMLILAFVGSSIQAGTLVCESHKEFSKSAHYLELKAIRAYLDKSGDLSRNHIVLCSDALSVSDLQVRLTYYYPDVTVITLDSELRPIYTSYYLQHRPDVRGRTIEEMSFDSRVHFAAVDSVYKTLQSEMPEFNKKYKVGRIDCM